MRKRITRNGGSEHSTLTNIHNNLSIGSRR